MARQWTPTHEIDCHGPGGDEYYYVALTPDGAAYTVGEWETDSQADCERHPDGTWTFQGSAAPAGVAAVGVSRLGAYTVIAGFLVDRLRPGRWGVYRDAGASYHRVAEYRTRAAAIRAALAAAGEA